MFARIKKFAVGIAASYVRKQATVDNLVEISCAGVNILLHKATSDVDPAKMEKVCDTCAKVSDICGTLSTTLRDGKVTADEASAIMTKVTDALGTSGVTDADLQSLVDKAEDAIKSRL